MNKRPHTEKKLNPVQYEMSNINPKYDEKTLLREMRKLGVNPMDLKLKHNTINHTNKDGKGHFFVNSSDSRKQQETM